MDKVFWRRLAPFERHDIVLLAGRSAVCLRWLESWYWFSRGYACSAGLLVSGYFRPSVCLLRCACVWFDRFCIMRCKWSSWPRKKWRPPCSSLSLRAR